MTKVLDADEAVRVTRAELSPAAAAPLIRWLELGWVEAVREQGQLGYRPTALGHEHISEIAQGLPS